MTTLLSWISVDQRGPSSVYIASDSRITWGTSHARWDSGRKVFASNSADLFGYSGEVLFPSLILSQLTELMDRGLLWTGDPQSDERHSIVLENLKRSLSRQHNAPNKDFTILHAARDEGGLNSIFRTWEVRYIARTAEWLDTHIDMIDRAQKSQLIIAVGSGKDALNAEIARWQASPQANTSRAIFGAFCDALLRGTDDLSGGMPQIVAISREGGGKVLGYAIDSFRYIYGLPVEYSKSLDNIEWIDRYFQRLSPETLTLLSGAQRHAPPQIPTSGGLRAFLRRFSDAN